MRKIVTVLFLLIIIMVFHGNAENYLLAEHEFDNQKSETFCGACEANPSDPNGGFLLPGFYSNMPYPEPYYPFLLRIDRFGNELWRKMGTIPNTVHGNGPKASHYTADGGFLVGGLFGLTKINSSGDIVSGWNPPIATVKDIFYIENYASNRYVILSRQSDTEFRCYTFYETNRSFSNPLIFPSTEKYYEVKLASSDKFIFCGEKIVSPGVDSLILYRTSTSLVKDASFGTKGNGKRTYPQYRFGSSIEVCNNGSEYIVACEQKSDNKIKLIKTNTTTGAPITSFNYSASLNIAYVQGLKKSLGIEQLSDGSFILGGKFTNTNDADLFMQFVSATGTGQTPKLFVNSGHDCDY